jgi:uncharacterized protein YndB with AHSA1/START domain
VFAFLADGENAPRWRSGVLDARHRSGGEQGAVYVQGVKGPFGMRVSADYEVTEHEPDRLLEFQVIAGPVRPAGSYVLEPVEGGTRVTFRLRCELEGIQRLTARRVARAMRSEVAQLERLREVLEE